MRSLIIAAVASIAALSFASSASAAFDAYNKTHPLQAGAGAGKIGVVHPRAVVHCRGKACHKSG